MMQKAGHEISCLYTSLPLKQSYDSANVVMQINQLYINPRFFYPPKCSSHVVSTLFVYLQLGYLGVNCCPSFTPPPPSSHASQSSELNICMGARGPSGSIRRGRGRARLYIVFGLSAVRSQTTESVVLLKQFPYSVKMSFPRHVNKGPVQQDLFPLKLDTVCLGRIDEQIQIGVPLRLDAQVKG